MLTGVRPALCRTALASVACLLVHVVLRCDYAVAIARMCFGMLCFPNSRLGDSVVDHKMAVKLRQRRSRALSRTMHFD